MKKILSILLSIAILATMCSQSIFAYASQVWIVANNVNVEYTKTFDVPVSISGNTDLMGFAFEISYDSNAVKPISVAPSASLENGTFNDSIGSDVYVNPMRVVWADTQPLTTDGELFTIKFEALNISASNIVISAIDVDTFDSSYNQVSISNCSINVNLKCNHQYTLVSVPATCISKGVDTYTCVTCGEVLTEYSNELEHNVIVDSAVNPTCTKSGLSEGRHCSECNAIIVKQQILDPVGHKFGDWENVLSPNCDSKGSQKRVCSECGFTETVNINEIGHKWQSNYIIDKVPTCTEEGSKSIHCSFCDAVKESTSIPVIAHNCNNIVTKATLSDDGKIEEKCVECGIITSTTVIEKPSTINLSATSYIYDGKVKKPTVTVTDSDGNTISSENYTVSYASGRKNVGKYAVKITFNGNYSGTKTLYFTIVPKATSISSVAAGSKAFTVKWKKQPKQTTGYEIQYATDSKFTKNKKAVTVSKNSTTSKKISKLSAKKKYYVRVRTYKTVNVNGKSTKLYSSWSKIKTVTTKK